MNLLSIKLKLLILFFLLQLKMGSCKKYLFAWFNFFMVLMAMVATAKRIMPNGNIGIKVDGPWEDAHATFYGDMSGSETMRKC